MAKYTAKQAKRKAEMVCDQLGGKIKAAVIGTGIDPAFLAGKIGVEAGVRNGKIVESATRYEHHHFIALKNIRDHGLHKGRKSFNGITQKQIKGASDAALKNLATSFGVSQIMAWHMINNLQGTVNDLRNPDKHLRYTIELMMITSGAYLTKKNYEAALRIWNTGRATGETHDPNYVHNALLVMSFAKPLLKEIKALAALPDIDGTMDVETVISEVETIEIDPDDDFTDVDQDGIDDDEDDDIDLAFSGMIAKPADQPDPTPVEQRADTIINNNPDPAQAAAPAQNLPPAPEPTEKEMQAPPPQDLKSKIRNFLIACGVPVTGAGITAAISTAWQDGSVNWRESFVIAVEVLRFVLPYATYAVISYVIYKTIQMIFIQLSFMKRMEINGDTTKNDIKLIQAPADDHPQKSFFQKLF